ncbi:MAG: hypothetical protein JW789_01010 [Candidatus Aenigmarchaeota archaeon]|nr:hypothetical protein [Candidatus Aenigmarchaeota archaeon]
MNEDIISGQKGTGLDEWAKKMKIDPLFAGSLAEAIDEPDETPYLLNAITDGFPGLGKNAKKEVRNALLRVQIFCSIHGNTDPIKISKQLFIAQTVERLLFGSNILMTEGMEEEEEEPRKSKTKK